MACRQAYAVRSHLAVMIPQGEPQQLGRGVVVRKVAARLDDLPQLRMHALERIGRVDQPADLRRKGKEGHDVRPGATPRRDHRRKFDPHGLRSNASRAALPASALGAV